MSTTEEKDKPVQPTDPAHHDEDSEGEITEAEKNQLKMVTEEPSVLSANEEEYMQRAKRLVEKVTGIEIKVDNPREVKAGAFSKNYIAYEIVGADKNGPINALRRYREFDTLRQKLKENWPGIFIPSLPEKKATTNADITAERQIFLDHFLKKCARLEYIFYSEEVQLFLRSTASSDELIKSINNISKKNCASIYETYKGLFPEFDDKVTKEKEEEVFNKIKSLKASLTEVVTMRNLLKGMRTYRPAFKSLKTDLTLYIGQHVMAKTKEKEERDAKTERISKYTDLEKTEDIKTLLSNLKVLQFDLEYFFQISNDLSTVYKEIGHNTGIVNDAQSQIQSIKVSDKDVVSEGLFKKVPKEMKLRELEKTLETGKENLEGARKLHDLIINLLDKQEVPLILYMKRMGLADGIMELAKRRYACLEKEREIIDMFESELSQSKDELSKSTAATTVA